MPAPGIAHRHLEVEGSLGSLLQSFTARHLATTLPDLVTASTDEEAQTVLGRGDLDVVPRVRHEVIDGFWSNEKPLLQPVPTGSLIGPRLPIRTVVHRLVQDGHLFLVETAGISGLVLRSDLNRPVVKLVLFGWYEEVERLLFRATVRHSPLDSLRGVVSAKRHEEVARRWSALERARLDHSPTGLLYFREVLHLALERRPIPLGVSRGCLAEFRNRVAHADRALVTRPSDIARLDRVFATLESLRSTFMLDDAPTAGAQRSGAAAN